MISIRKISNWGSQIPEQLLIFTSKWPLRVQISQELGPFLQIELLETGRSLLRWPQWLMKVTVSASPQAEARPVACARIKGPEKYGHFKLIFPHVLFSGGVLFSRRPSITRCSAPCSDPPPWRTYDCILPTAWVNVIECLRKRHPSAELDEREHTSIRRAKSGVGEQFLLQDMWPRHA